MQYSSKLLLYLNTLQVSVYEVHYIMNPEQVCYLLFALKYGSKKEAIDMSLQDDDIVVSILSPFTDILISQDINSYFINYTPKDLLQRLEQSPYLKVKKINLLDIIDKLKIKLYYLGSNNDILLNINGIFLLNNKILSKYELMLVKNAIKNKYLFVI